jgi:hypothetical protein
VAKRYKVTAPCVVNVPVSSEQGAQLTTFYRDALLPAGVPADRVKHLLDSNLIEQVKGDTSVEEEQQDKVPEQEETPEVPAVNSRSSKQDLVAYGVAKGDGTPEALDALTRDQLLDRYVRPPQ